MIPRDEYIEKMKKEIREKKREANDKMPMALTCLGI